MEHKSACLLYGQLIEGLLYGEGKKITRKGALEDYSKEGFSIRPTFYYWGDLDYEGIGIFLSIAGFPVRLFTPGYVAMLQNCLGEPPSHCRTSQTPPQRMDEFLKNFDSTGSKQVTALLESGKYIPQEICNYPRLAAAISKC